MFFFQNENLKVRTWFLLSNFHTTLVVLLANGIYFNRVELNEISLKDFSFAVLYFRESD